MTTNEGVLYARSLAKYVAALHIQYIYELLTSYLYIIPPEGAWHSAVRKLNKGALWLKVITGKWQMKQNSNWCVNTHICVR